MYSRTLFEAYGARCRTRCTGVRDTTSARWSGWPHGADGMDSGATSLRFGRLVNASGESSVEWYECGSPQLITLYETLRDTPGVYGARVQRGRFPGKLHRARRPRGDGWTIAAAVHAVYPRATRGSGAVQHSSM